MTVPAVSAAWKAHFHVPVVPALAWGETTMDPWQAGGILLLLGGVALGTRAHVTAHAHADTVGGAS